MSFFIYLDQNTLSELRQRKVERSEIDGIKFLNLALQSEQVTLIYSYVTLEEISQITNIEYIHEHIDLLGELSAKYINPLTSTLDDRSPKAIWTEYIEIKKENQEMGIDSLMHISQLFSRKISGLPVNESFDEINIMLKDSLNQLLTNCETHLTFNNQIPLNKDEKKQLIDMQTQMNELREKLDVLKPLEINSRQELGPNPFRETPEIKALQIEKMHTRDVVNTIERIFKTENNDFILEQYFDHTIQSDIARAYSLMNWAGYFPDDFTRIKKSKDRFNASNKDMQHVIAALDADFLISSDHKFRKKALACYAYVNSKTVVCSPKEFINNHCKFV